MRTVAGIFQSREAAKRAVELLRSTGIPEERINMLAPGTTTEELDAAVPTTETEQPGMGKAIGGTVGGALGVAGGMHIGAAAASLFVPGVGPVIAAGLIGAALWGSAERRPVWPPEEPSKTPSRKAYRRTSFMSTKMHCDRDEPF